MGLLFTAEQSSVFADFCGIFIAVYVILYPYIYYGSGQISLESIFKLKERKH